MERSLRRRGLATLLVAVGLTVAMAGPAGATASQGTPGQLGGQWWKWAFSMPADATNPLNGGDCMNGQADNGYIFLSGVYFDETVPGAEVAQRDCAVPAGRPLFFPIVNTECSSIEAGTIWGGTNGTALAACLGAWSFEGTATLDGEELDLVTAVSGVYRIAPLPANNLLAAPAGTSGISKAAGLYGFTAPLAAGEHELSFIGTASYDGRFGEAPFDYKLAVDYTITAS